MTTAPDDQTQEDRPEPLPADLDLDSYDLDIPPGLIAQAPPEHRGDSRLMVLDRATGTTTPTRFRDLGRHLPPGSLLVVNNSRVIPARLYGARATGGRVEMLLLTPLPALAPRPAGLNRPGVVEAEATCLLRSAKRVKPGEVVTFDDRLQALVLDREEYGRARVRLSWQGELGAILEELGTLPLPPYIERPATEADRRRYQTIFADPQASGSVAAPTAGLHFTPELVASLTNQGLEWAEVTLYVGYGTFSPVRERDIRRHRMHAEHIELSPDAAARINAAKAQGRPVVAVGTTSVRVLESVHARLGRVEAFAGETDLFITPGFKFQVVDHLLTNFHLPRSSLIIMVSALAGRERILAAYRRAAQERMRFYSYGDAMLIL